MECKHKPADEPSRPRSIITFEQSEVAKASRDYVEKAGERIPDGEMSVWGIESDRKLELCIKRAAGQEVWPPAT